MCLSEWRYSDSSQRGAYGSGKDLLAHHLRKPWPSMEWARRQRARARGRSSSSPCGSRSWWAPCAPGPASPPCLWDDLRGHFEAKAWEQPFLFSGIPLSDILPPGLKCQGGKSRALLNALVGTRLWLAFPAHEGGSVAAVAGGRLEPWEVDRRTRVQGCLTRFLAEQRLVPKQTSKRWFPSRALGSFPPTIPSFSSSTLSGVGTAQRLGVSPLAETEVSPKSLKRDTAQSQEENWAVCECGVFRGCAHCGAI